MKQEKFQFTFRIGQTFRQYMQMAYTEEEGRLELAKTLLQKEGIAESNANYQTRLEELLRDLKMVQRR